MSIPKSKSRLGRGLNSLMGFTPGQGDQVTERHSAMSASGDTTEPPITLDAQPFTRAVLHGTPAAVPIDHVLPNPRQPRRSFDPTTLAELAGSIKTNGLIQPITVRVVGDHYELIAGERRLRAAKIAGLTVIPAYLRDADELAQAQLALVENIQREDLNPIDRATGYRTLVTELGLTQAELATRLGEDRSSISNHLRLLDLAAPCQTLLRDGALSLGHAKVLCGVTDRAEQARLADLVVTQSLSVRNLERIITSPVLATAATSTPAPSAHVRDVEVKLSKQLGLRVQVRTGTNKTRGKVVIHYASLDEFDALLGRIGAALED